MKIKLSFLSFMVMTLFTLTPMLPANADLTRLYIGDWEGSFMAGIDSRMEFGPLFVGGDVRTIIDSMIQDKSKYALVGFAPQRTDYTFIGGINLGSLVLEYASTCYHHVIASKDLSVYANLIEIPNTQTFKMKWLF